MSLELDYLFHPRSIAVAGASPEERTQGHLYFQALRENGFAGPVYPVNPRVPAVLGVPCYPSVASIPGALDYVVSAVPAGAVLSLVEDCAAKDVKALHLFTARFSETGRAEDAALEQEVLRRARRAGLRIIGPNCMGLYYPRQGLTFMGISPNRSGPVGFLSQSGGNALDVIVRGSLRGVGFSKVVSFGNALDLNEADFLEYLAEDPETSVIGLYLEGVKEGRRFLRALASAARVKPVVVLKGGRSTAGTQAVASHTASLAGDRRVWETACRQAGAVPVTTLGELVDLLVAFTLLPPLLGTRVAVGGGGGGSSVLAADVCEEEGLRVLPLPPEIRATFREREPRYADWIGNPVDGSILGGSPWRTEEVLGLLAQSPHYDAVIVNLDELWAFHQSRDPEQMPRALEAHLGQWRQHGKPMALVLEDGARPQEWHTQVAERLRLRAVAEGLPIFPSIERAARSIRRLVDYYRRRQGL